MPDFLKKFPFLKDPEPPALWKAARDGDVETIKRLVAEGAKVNAHFDGLTPLHVAAIHKQGQAIKEFVKVGAKINARSEEGTTPVKFAIKNGADANLIELMIQLGADINKGLSPPLSEAAAGGDEQMVRFLLEHGANPNGSAKNTVGGPLLDAAGKNVAVVKMLLKAGAKVNPEPGRDSPLACAAIFGKLDIVHVLLAAGANPNHPDNCNETPLMSAVMSREEDTKAEVVQSLLAAGADVNAKSMDQRTALDRAEWLNLPDIIKILKQAGAKRGSELPKIAPDLFGTSWELEHSMVLGADIEPRPAKEGRNNLKIEITTDDYNRGFSGALEFRIVHPENNSGPWLRVFGEMDEDGAFLVSIGITLTKGENIIQFRIKDKEGKDFIELEGWPFVVH